MKVWKTVEVKGELPQLAKALNAIEEKMEGTVFAVMPWNMLRSQQQGRYGYDVVYYLEREP